MRHLDKIILHYSATPPGRDVSAAEIRRWHLDRGWSDIGYHFVVRLSGKIEPGRPIDRVGAHCRGHNTGSIGICYVGGGSGQDTREIAQKASLARLIDALRVVFGPLPVYGHREMRGASTLCPGFTASDEYNRNLRIAA